MHTAELLSKAIELSRRVGYQIREEVLEGAGGGHCLIGGQKWLLLDLTQTQKEQLGDVLDALRAEPQLELSGVPEVLVDNLRLPRAA
ncbi:MAG: hypothetical protein AAGD11_06155 [Planctomycetota bacterium]